MAREFGSFSSSENKQQGGGGGGGVGKIYKLVGPVLLAQDKSEAILAVQARLDFIEKEMYVFEISLLSFSFLFLHNDDHDHDQEGGPTSSAYLFSDPPLHLTYQGRERSERRRYLFIFFWLGVLLIRPFSGGDRIESG